MSIVASVLWLVLLVLAISSNMRVAGGVRRFSVELLGRYARHHFVRAAPATGHANNISIGFSICGHDQIYLRVNTDAISSICWSSGQATAMSGRDMNDWHVAMWYHHPDGPQRKPFPGVRDEEVYIIGPSGPGKLVETFGQHLVEFLSAIGVKLAPGNNCEFNTPARRRPDEEGELNVEAEQPAVREGDT
jgi:hypothetical protein